jgi:hypothetical protein
MEREEAWLWRAAPAAGSDLMLKPSSGIDILQISMFYRATRLDKHLAKFACTKQCEILIFLR